MQERNQLVFLLNSTSYSVNIDFAVLSSINNDISTSLFQNRVYDVQSNVSSEVFQAFINYLFHVNRVIPNITPQNISQYYLLNQEFQSETMRNLIESQRGTFNELTVNLINLKNPLVQDKTLIEQSIARNLNEYVTEHGEELISAPINSLMLILTHRDLVFTQYDRLYELIVSEYQRTNNLSIFALFSTFKLSQLSLKNQRDSIEKESQRAGMIPKPDILSMINKIEKQKQQINNFKKISLIYIRNQFANLNNYEQYYENRFIHACESGNIDEVSMCLNNEIEEGDLKYRLNLSDFTAKVVPIRRPIRQENLIIPKSVTYRNKRFIVTSVDERAIEYSEVRNIIFPENSKVRFIHDNAFVCFIQTIKLPPLLDNFSVHFNYEIIPFSGILLWPNSRNIRKVNNQLLLEKSDINSDVFDVLSFVDPSTQTITIPDYITKISANAFEKCFELREVNFSVNSQLQLIDENAFLHLNIREITIPSHVK